MINNKCLDLTDLQSAIVWLENNRKHPFPKRIRKPRLTSTNPSKEELDVYIIELQEYEKLNNSYEESVKLYNEENCEIIDYINNRIKEDSGLNNIVPEQYRNNVFSYAYDRSHSEGAYQVYVTICNLVDIFKV